MREILLSSCKLFRAVLASGKRKRVEYKITKRSTEEVVGFVYSQKRKHRDQWVFDPLLTVFTPTELMDLASFVTLIKIAVTGLEED